MKYKTTEERQMNTSLAFFLIPISCWTFGILLAIVIAMIDKYYGTTDEDTNKNTNGKNG